MSGVKVRIRQESFSALGNALAEAEEVVFLYATYTDGVFEVNAMEIMMGGDIARQSKLHVELADGVRPRVIKTAWDTDRCLIEAHSHGEWGYAEFSQSDLHGFEEWVTHVRWRLRGRPYVALVKAGETWDALAWVDGDEPIRIDAIEVTSADSTITSIVPTNATAAKLAADGQVG
jgi:hypothetical protein